MFNLNYYKKKFRKLLISINRILESFFIELGRSKHQKNKSKPFRKKLIDLEHKFESFFNKFKEFKKYNQSKKKLSFFKNKTVLSIAIIFISFLSYFSVPVFYNEDVTKNFLKNQINKTYEIEIKFNEKVKYSLIPKPYFYTKNLDIFYDGEIIGNSNHAKFYISFNNFFSFEKLNIKDVIFKNTDFNVNANNINFFTKTLKKSGKQDNFLFKKSKLFYKDQNDELLFLSKVHNLKFFYDDKNGFQKVKTLFEIFNIPFKLDVSKDLTNQNKIIKLISKKIRLDLESSIEYDNSEISGFLDIDLFNKSNSFDYVIKSEKLNFASKDKNFSGGFNFKPFYFFSNLRFDYVSHKKIFKSESLMLEILDSELLNNRNLSANINISVNKIDKFEYLTDFILEIQFDNGQIFMSNFDVEWNQAVSIKSNDIEFINDENGKKLIGEISFDFKDVEKFFRYFQIKRNYRNVFDEINVDFVYDFTEEKLILNNIKIDNKSNQILESFLEEHNNKNKNLFNKVTLRNFVKDFFLTYAG